MFMFSFIVSYRSYQSIFSLQDLQKYLDDSKEGCIYVSFGTTVNSKYLSNEQKQTFVKVFKDITPMRVLWKFDEVDVANKSKNVEIRTWLPQQDVLRKFSSRNPLYPFFF